MSEQKEQNSPIRQHPQSELGNANASGHASPTHSGESTAEETHRSPESLPRLALRLWRELDSLDWNSHQNAICGIIERNFNEVRNAALEEAAKVAEQCHRDWSDEEPRARHIAKAIRMEQREPRAPIDP